ncbi:response regulator [Thermodesulfobacteriota bacterium]
MKKVLIVEDDPNMLNFYARAIESLGHVALRSSNGRRALAVLEDNSDIAFVITDVMMPEMDGRQFVQAVRSNDRYDDVPILIVSGAIRARDISELLEIGATYFMPKMTPLKEVKKLIQEHI